MGGGRLVRWTAGARILAYAMGPGSIAASVRSVFSSDSRRPSGASSRETGSRKSGSAKSISAKSGSASIDADSSASDSGSDDDSDADDEVFSYARVAALPAALFRRDMLSACRIHSNLHVYGTDGGVVHIADGTGAPLRTVRVHRSAVLYISVDASAKFFATASIDGTVMVASVRDPNDTVQANFRRPVHAIALSPNYSSTRSYVSGGTAGQIVLSERGWLKARADTVLAQTTSAVLALAWTPRGLVWCNDDGLTVYDMDARTVRGQIPRPEGRHAEGYTPRLAVSGTMVTAAWAHTVLVVDIAQGELVHRLELAFPVAGAVPFHQSQIAVLAVGRRSAELKLLSSTTGVEVYADELEMHRVDRDRGGNQVVNQFHLVAESPATAEVAQPEPKSEETQSMRLWIVSPKDAIIARERNARDHLDWLVAHSKFVEAYQAAKTAKFEVEKIEKIGLGLRAAQQLVDQQLYEPAAFILPEILSDPTQWLLWSNQFISAGHSLTLGDVVPASALGGKVHDTILEAAVSQGDYTRLRTWVKAWPLDVYDGVALAERLERVVNAGEGGEPALLVYADLLLKLGEYVRAALALVRANAPQVFRVVSHYHLWTEPEIVAVLGQVITAGDGDLGDGQYVNRLRELIAVRSEISPQRVAAQLQSEKNQDLLLFGYLSELRLVDETLVGEKPLVDLMVRLYAQYDRRQLLGFLEKFDTYDIDASVAMCRELGLTNELVYLLGRLGQSHEALSLIVTELHDYDRAVAFARTQDAEIWDELVSYVGQSQSPELVLALLRCVEVSPARVLAMVPADMPIPGLKTALCRVINGQEVSVALHEGALTIVNNEARRETQTLRSKRLAGLVGGREEKEEGEEKQEGQENEEDDPSDSEIPEGEPFLLSEKNGRAEYTPVEPFRGDTRSLAGKIRHLRSLWA